MNPEITSESGPEGLTLAADQASLPREAGPTFKIELVGFMQEDYLDALEARAALEDPANSDRIPWDQLRERLGL